MSSPRRNLSESIPPQQKKPKLEEETPVGGGEDQVTSVKVEDQQLVERKWVKVAEVEEKKDQKLFKVMQWNSLADGELALRLNKTTLLYHVYHWVNFIII